MWSAPTLSQEPCRCTDLVEALNPVLSVSSRYECEDCGEPFETLTRLRLHDCQLSLTRFHRLSFRCTILPTLREP